MPSSDVHVVSAGDRWAVVADRGHGRETFRTLEEAITAGAEKARQRQVELLIHGRDGQIRERNPLGLASRDIKE
ncbi:DUF2188 domain-containing protein [Cupriavidus taiwanensis]|uniref:DUF2188 domain-containing protein n=1 Tax=Cupriavidus taiwanensis TaxID=164546 RepID=UPI0015724045|nr:DUF2188 domain-containing protein [Cupriavidus taiwanensis]NSX15963.1 DUF2188 domain-containing protein [Cupriavidus taiwanensis]